MIIKQKNANEDGTINYNYSRKTSVYYGLQKPIWLFFSGMGSQWSGMAKSMMAIEKFKESIHKCCDALSPFKVNLINILLSEDKSYLDSILNPFIGITATQIALFDVILEFNQKKSLDIRLVKLHVLMLMDV